ncbi:MAG: D-alanine--D-alanine ligase [bacterium]
MKTLKEKKICVLAGGKSSEKEISLKSGTAVLNCLKKANYNVFLANPFELDTWINNCDIVFIAMHGKYGEDGQIQRILEKHRLPYTGSGINASINCMNKWTCKQYLEQANLPVPAYSYHQSSLKKLPPSFTFPVVLKPLDQGSSIGVHIIKTPEELQKKSNLLITTYQQFLLERYISGRELTIGIIEKNQTPIALPILELQSKNEFYDYNAKYTKGLTKFIIPAELPPKQTKKLQNLAISAHKTLNCLGFSRIDFLLDQHHNPYILEINTIPGFTETSDLPAQAKAAGLSFLDLIVQLLQNAIDAHGQT